MKTINLFVLLVLLLSLNSCKKDDTNPLDEFRTMKPNSWSCQVVENSFDNAEIPQGAEDPLAIVKYTNVNVTFKAIGETLQYPSLILCLYPISDREKLIRLIKSQQLYSWCIPIYYGETEDYFILTSPCFRNGGTSTDEANSAINELYNTLDRFIDKEDIN